MKKSPSQDKDLNKVSNDLKDTLRSIEEEIERGLSSLNERLQSLINEMNFSDNDQAD